VYPDELMKKIAEKGLFGMIVPEKYGGLALDTVSYAIAVEETSRVCGSTGIMLAAHNSLGAFPFVLFGNEEQKRSISPTWLRGTDWALSGLLNQGQVPMPALLKQPRFRITVNG